MIPDTNQCLLWLQECKAPQELIIHVRAVHDKAIAIGTKIFHNGHNVDISIIAAAALLHDIGRTFTSDPTHGYKGAEWLRKKGCNEHVCLCVERHILAGISLDEALSLGMPEKSYFPESMEEKIVAHADNLTGKKKSRPIETLLEKLKNRAQNDMAARVLELHKNITALAGTDDL
jgi:uncharacterized protein (TIGR00295 family)